MHVDEMVFRGLQKYKNYNFVNIETNYEDFSKDLKPQEADKVNGLPEDDITTFCLWTKNELQPIVSKVQVSKRLSDSPAIVVSQWSSGMRQVLTMLDKSQGMDMNKNLTFEINPNHELIVKLNQLRKTNAKFASTILKQLLDNTLVSAGIMGDVKQFVNRINKIMIHGLDKEIAVAAGGDTTSTQDSFREEESSGVQVEDSVLHEVSKDKAQNDFKAEIIIDKDGNPQVKRD